MGNKLITKLKLLIRPLLSNEIVQAALIVILTQTIFFYPVFFEGEVIAPDLHLGYAPYESLKPAGYQFDSTLKSDQLDSYYPGMKLFFGSIKGGEFPLWENNTKFGMPVDTIFGYYYPPEYLALILPLEVSHTFNTIIKFFISGMFMYLFLKKIKINHYGSIFGAIIFMYSGFNVVWNWGHSATTSLMLPLFFFFGLSIAEKKYWYGPLLAILTAFSILTGFVAGAGYVLYLLALYLLLKFSVRILRHSNSKYSFRKIMQTLFPFLVIGFFVMIGISLTIFVLFPTLDYLDYIDVSYRENNASRHLQLVPSLLQMIMPYYNGGELVGSFIGEANYNETSSYIGLTGLIFTTLGLTIAIAKKNKNMIFFTFISILTVMVVYGIGPVLGVINKLPLLNNSSNTRLIMWFCFSASILAAYGLSEIAFAKEYLLRYRESFRKHSKQIIAVVFVLTIGAIGFVVFDIVSILLSYETIKDALSAEKIHFYRLANVLASITLSTLVSILVYLTLRSKRNIQRYVFLIIILSFSELFTYGLKQVATVDQSLFYPDTAGIEVLKANTDTRKNLGRTIAFDSVFVTRGTEKYYDLAVPFDHALYSSQERLIIEKLTPMAENRWATPTMPIISSAETDFSSEIFDKLNVKFLVFDPDTKFDPQQMTDIKENFELVYEEELLIYENKSGYSLTHTTQPAKIEIIEIKNNTQKYSVKSDTINTFYVSEINYPNWTVRVNKEEAEIKEIDEIWRGVDIEPGENVIEFEYEPTPVYKYGIIYSFSVATVLILGELAYLIRGRRNAKHMTSS